MRHPHSIPSLEWRRVQVPDFRAILDGPNMIPGLISEPRIDGIMYLAPVGKAKGLDQEYREVAFRGDLSTYWVKDL